MTKNLMKCVGKKSHKTLLNIYNQTNSKVSTNFGDLFHCNI